MSNLLTMEDFEGMKQSIHNMSSFEMLRLVASVAANKYDSANKNDQNIESNLGGNDSVVQKKTNSLRSVIRIQHNEEQNITSYVIRSPSKIHDKREQNVLDSGIGKSSRKTDIPKRKLEETMSNEECIDAVEMKIKKKNIKRGSRNPPPPPLPRPRLAEEFERKIINEYGGTRIMRVIQKSLSSTDVSKGHSRVSIPFSQVESFRFLDDDEMAHLRNQKSITVPLIHMPKRNGVCLPLTETSMEFRLWNMRKGKNDIRKVSHMYVLRTNWNKIVSTDQFKKRDVIQIWAFRDGHNKLCMALVKL